MWCDLNSFVKEVFTTTKQVSCFSCRPSSRVKNLTFMTTFWLRCFDDWFDFLELFKKHLAPVSLAKIPAFFSRGVNPKWPPAPLWKNNFWHIKAPNMNKFTFFRLIRPQGIHFCRQFGIKTHFWPLNPRWPTNLDRISIFSSETEFEPLAGWY